MTKITTEITPIKSLLLGFGFSVALSLPPFFLIQPFLVKAGTSFVIFIYFFLGGILKKIPVSHKGVPTILGLRIKSIVYSEGVHWNIPYPFGGAEVVDTKEHTSDPGVIEVLNKNKIRIKVDVSIQWAVVDPYMALNVGINVIQDGMLKMINTITRNAIKDKTTEETVSIYDLTRDEIFEEANIISKRWGIAIREVMVTQISIQEDVMRDYERRVREKIQSEFEKTELEHVTNRTKELVKELGISTEKALDVVQTERDKVKRTIDEKVYKGLEGTNFLGAMIAGILNGNKDERKNNGGN